MALADPANVCAVEADAIQVATLIGTAIGTMVGSYFVASRATKRRMDSEPPPGRISSLPVDLAPLTQKVEGLERELRQEVRAMESKIAALSGDALTVDEFQTYTTMDSERRERLIAKIGELQGTIAAMLPHMRK